MGLTIDLLGTFSVALNGQAIHGFRSSKERALLAYLVLEADRAHARGVLAALLWSETSNQTAANNLRLTFHRLRRNLDAAAAGAGNEVLGANHLQIWIKKDGVALDATDFQMQLAEVREHGHALPDLCQTCAQRLERAVALYRGDLLAGFALADAPMFEEWLLVERERLRRECIWALHTLTTAYERQGDFDRALTLASRQVEMDPYREEAYRLKMRILASQDRRSEAVACYLACKRTLSDELGIAPDAETTALFDRILSGDALAATPTSIRIANFPTQFTPLVGRESELQAIRRRLLDPDCRLLTLTGLGGAGKTRLAVEAARLLTADSDLASDRFSDGVVFFSLASVSSPDYLPAVFAHDLGLTPHDRASVTEQVVDFLRRKHMLLVIDNFEHLTESALWLRTILEESPGVKMLVTSRLPLGLQVEERMAVGGLEYPAAGETTVDVAGYSALRFFVQSARRARQEFRLAPGDVPHVVHICELVDGRPLALELAAGWVRLYECADIVREIERSSDFLRTTLRDVPQRHRSVRTIFNHTWDMLSPSQRSALANLTVFRGPFKLEAALAVADTSVVDLAALLDAALLQRTANGWYDLHFLIRQFAAQHNSGQPSHAEAIERAMQRHSEYHLAFLASMEPALTGQEPQVAVTQVHQRLDDIRQALRLAGERGWLASLEQSLASLGHFYELSGLVQEGIGVLGAIVEDLRKLKADDASVEARNFGLQSRMLAWQSYFLDRRGQANESIAVVLEALALADKSHDVGSQSEVRSQLGARLPHRGEFPLAVQHLEQAIAGFRSLADEASLAVALTRLGVVHWRWGRYGDSEPFFQEALALQAKLQNRLGTARVLWSMGGVAFEQRKYDEALMYALKTRTIYEAIGDRSGMATLDGNLALLSQARGDYATALDYNQNDLDHDLATGNRHGESVAISNRGGILLDAGDLEQALACFQRALNIQQELDNPWEVARHRASIASIWISQGELDKALTEYEQAIPILRAHGASFYLVGPLLELAHLLADNGDLKAAQHLATEGSRLVAELGQDDLVMQYRVLTARLDYAAGEPEAALKRLREIAQEETSPSLHALAQIWLWRLAGREEDRVAAVDLYADLHRQAPKHEYRARLQELTAPGAVAPFPAKRPSRV